MKDLISIKELKREEIESLLKRAYELKQKPPGPILQGHVMASCFFEPSTRTRLSFEAAMKRLGGEVIGFADDASTSLQKGESIYDSMKIIGLYSDVVVIRHPLEGSARQAARATDKPVINAGDGANEHPTQTLLDLFTIEECLGKPDGLHIAFVGDLHFGRTVHSLAYALKQFDVRLYFVSPPSLSMPPAVCEELKRAGVPFSFHNRIEEVVGRSDILYMTRVQKERFHDAVEYNRVKDRYILTRAHLEEAKEGLKVLHPLPRLNEIAPEVDETCHAYYFPQAENGLYVRQALLCKLLGK
ncbi:MAG: aspartate carbamoyltransferase [Chlamydiales bacterium]|nr:aspartate carbamoyltransferase [Chlamydiales bacterium]